MTDEDTLVLVGDHSWGRKLAECETDLQYICDLPGRKILTRGNHDMFWDVKKTGRLNEIYQPGLTFLQDSYESYQDYALVGTKGFTFEGPFYLDRRGRIITCLPSGFHMLILTVLIAGKDSGRRILPRSQQRLHASRQICFQLP